MDKVTIPMRFVMEYSIHPTFEKEADIFQYVVDQVCEFTDISITRLKHRTRKREVVVARQMAMYLIYRYTNYGTKYIGEFFGGRDHTTVIHARAMIEDLLSNKSFEVYLVVELVSGKFRALHPIHPGMFSNKDICRIRPFLTH